MALPQQPLSNLAPGQPLIPGVSTSPFGLPPNGLTGGLNGIPQNGFNFPNQAGIGNIPPAIQKREVDVAEQFRQYSLPSSFSPPIFGGSNQPIFFTASPPVLINKRSVDLGSTPSLANTGSTVIRAKRGLFGSDEATPVAVKVSSTPITPSVRVKRGVDITSTPIPSVMISGQPRVKRGLFGGSETVATLSSGLPYLSSVTPSLKRR